MSLQHWTSSLEPGASGSGPAQLLAYVDESMRELPDGSAKYYFLAAAVIPETACDATRNTMRPLLLGKEPRLHWTREGDTRKQLITKTISQTPVESVVLVGAMLRHDKEERARSQVLKHLLWELDSLQVRHVVLESRGATPDRRDLTLIGGLRNSQHLSRRLAVSHGRPIQEPLLWIPDAVAGAAGDRQCGNPRHYEILQTRVRLIEIGQV